MSEHGLYSVVQISVVLCWCSGGNQLTYLGRSQFSVSSLETDVRLFACLFALDSCQAGIFVSES